MSTKNLTIRSAYVHPDDPANHIKPGEAFIVDGLDWSWAFCIFRPIEGFPGYCVGSNGTAWTLKKLIHTRYGNVVVMGDTWHPLKLVLCNRHYVVGFREGGKVHTKRIHRLILEAFIGPCPPHMQGCHWDDDPTNNRIFNLRWDTSKSNHADAFRNGRRIVGDSCSFTKYSDALIREVREEFAKGEISAEELAIRYGIPKVRVLPILLGKTRLRAGGPIAERKKRFRGFDQAKAEEVRNLVASGMSCAKVAAIYRIHYHTVRRIVTGVTWAIKPRF